MNERQTVALEYVLSEFPFLQSARALYLKGLYNQDSFRYNTELKKTAAYTTDRSVLFDLITSSEFQSIQKKFYEEQEQAVDGISVADSEIVVPVKDSPVVDKVEESIKRSIKASGVTEEAALPEQLPYAIAAMDEPAQETATAEQHLSIGKPLEFDTEEKHSFAEWLQLSKLTPINREETPKQPESTEQEDNSLAKKLELIDKFIENSPKIGPAKNITQAPANIERSTEDNSSLMTETLARVYLEQKKYSKAIQAYEILILKYPEKSVFFADRISEIKSLQQNNN